MQNFNLVPSSLSGFLALEDEAIKGGIPEETKNGPRSKEPRVFYVKKSSDSMMYFNNVSQTSN